MSKLTRGLMRGLMLAAVVAAAAMYAGSVLATPATIPPGFVSSTIAVGRFGDIEVLNQAVGGLDGSPAIPRLWLSHQTTKGQSDVYVQSNVWQAGASTGWHTHPGHSLIIVTAGAVTAYEADCTPTVYAAGHGFVDPGGDHVHLLKNEGTVEARTYAVQLIPAGATRRIDAAEPDTCQGK